MKNKGAAKVIIGGLIIMLIVCLIVISVFAFVMHLNSDHAISDIGTIYMNSMNQEISLHFQSIIEIRLDQIKTIIQNNPPKEAEYGYEMKYNLTRSATIRNFSFLALMSREGDLDIILGDEMKIEDGENFLKHLNSRDREERRAVFAHTISGEPYILMGVSTVYPMEDSSKECTALVAGVPADYFNELLSLSRNKNVLTFSNIIDKEGDYIIKNYDDKYDNYFERVSDIFLTYGGKSADSYIAEIKSAMEKSDTYSTVFQIAEERRHLYCSPLPNSEWYLLTIMPFGEIEGIIGDLSMSRMYLLFWGTLAIVITVILIIIFYYRYTNKQFDELTAAREEAEKANRAKSEFLSNMSHDIRTPMNAIIGMTAIAMSNIDNPEKLKNTLQKISRSNKQLLGLINDILDMSKIESGRMTLSSEQVSLREVIDDIVNIVQSQIKANNQEFDVYIHDIITENVNTDSVRLNQVIMNLLSNAIKFTPEGGKVSVSMYQEPSDKGDSYVRVHLNVKDTGIGMSPEFKEKVFDSFAREDSKRVRKTQGTGLGMAITKYIVDAMNGTIEVFSTQGLGTEFRITVDMEKAFDNEEELTLPSDWKVLIVDDDEMLRESAAHTFGELGITIDCAEDSASAMEKIEAMRKKGEEYKVVLLDWHLPDIDGVDNARKIKEKFGGNEHLIMITAYDWIDIEDSARAAGIVGFITKPLFKSTLYHALRRFDSGEAFVGEEHLESKKDYSNVKVLVAEDNDLNWEIANELFSSMGFRMEHAENGKICVDMFSDSEVGYYSVILMDLRMPIMNGTEATEAIRALGRPDSDIPIIAMTADAFAEDIKRCLDSGMNAHVAKPIQPQEVIRTIEKFIGNRETIS